VAAGTLPSNRIKRLAAQAEIAAVAEQVRPTPSRRALLPRPNALRLPLNAIGSAAPAPVPHSLRQMGIAAALLLYLGSNAATDQGGALERTATAAMCTPERDFILQCALEGPEAQGWAARPKVFTERPTPL
jgi:hypothetical protein